MPSELRVWHIPQIPMQPFYVGVDTPGEAVILLDVLANYDRFQYENNVKGDYANAQGLDVFEDGEWTTWYDEETGLDIRDWARDVKGF